MKRFISLFLTLALLLTVTVGLSSVEARADGLAAGLRLELKIEKAADATLSFYFLNIADLNYVVQPGDVLEYDVMMENPLHGVGHVDAALDNGGWLRDCGVMDTDGANCHPMGDLRGKASGVIYHRSMLIGDSVAGRTIEKLQLAAHPDANAYEQYENGTYVVWYGNIRITNNGEVKKVIYEKHSDFANLQISNGNSQNITGTVTSVAFDGSDQEDQGGTPVDPSELAGWLKLDINVQKDAAATLSYYFLTIANIQYEIQAGDVLEYDVYMEDSLHGFGHVETGLPDSTWQRDFGIMDTDGANCHPMGDLRSRAYQKIYHRNMLIGDKMAGKTIDKVQLAAHPDAGAYEQYENGVYTVYYNNIRITNNGETKLVIFDETTDFSAMTLTTGFTQNITGELSQVAVNNPPRTGDAFPFVSVVAAMLLSCAALVVLADKKRAVK